MRLGKGHLIRSDESPSSQRGGRRPLGPRRSGGSEVTKSCHPVPRVAAQNQDWRKLRLTLISQPADAIVCSDADGRENGQPARARDTKLDRSSKPIPPRTIGSKPTLADLQTSTWCPGGE